MTMCEDDSCESLANYTCKICAAALCLEHAFPQADEDGWLCGPCFVMPKSRQEFWAAKFDAERRSLESPTFDDYVPDYTGDGLDYYVDPHEFDDDEPDMECWEEESEDREESEDLLDHLEEDLDGPAINSRALALAEIERDYETDNWQAQELERDLYDDDDEYEEDDDYDDYDDYDDGEDDEADGNY